MAKGFDENSKSSPWTYDPETMPPNSYLITLVHGTWGRGFFPHDRKLGFRRAAWKDKLKIPKVEPRWFDRDSDFQRKLSGLYGHHQVRSFRWSGSNSIFARDLAARKLAKLLDNDLARYPSLQPAIIAHSHGGNIGVRAIQLMQGDKTRVRLVTMATPFLRLFTTQHYAFDYIVKWALSAVLITAALYSLSRLEAYAQWSTGMVLLSSALVIYCCLLASSIFLVFIINTDRAFIHFRNILPSDFWFERPARIAEATYYNFNYWGPRSL